MDKKPIKRIPLLFYRSVGDREPVREWLKGLEYLDRHAIGMDLMRVQWRWPIGMPLCRPLGQGLWEVRTNLPSNRIGRVLFCLHEGALVALHGFIKKTEKIPDNELKIAIQRKEDLKK